MKQKVFKRRGLPNSQKSGPLFELADHQAVRYVFLLFLEVVRPELADAVHRHFLSVLVLLDVHEDARQLTRSQEPPEAIEYLLQILGLSHQLLLDAVKLLHQTVVPQLFLLDGRLVGLQQLPLFFVHAHVSQHFLPPLFVLVIGLRGRLREKVEVLASREDQKFLTLRNEGFEDLLEVVVDGLHAILAMNSQPVTQR